MEIFTQFSSDLDETTKKQLKFGQGLMQLLKQDQFSPMSQAQQVITLVVALNRLLLEVDTKQIKQTMQGIINYIHMHEPSIITEIEEKKQLIDHVKDRIIILAKEYLSDRK